MTDRPERMERSLPEGSFRLFEALEPIRRRLRPHVSIDTRSLAALRIALGGIVLVDLYHRSRSFELFYTERGVYPLSVHEAAYGAAGTVSLHAVSGAAWFQGALFAIAGLFALAFLVGYRTRLTGAISLILLVSLHVRYPAVLNGGDRLLRVLLLVALLTPLGERWSIGSLRRGSARRHVASVGTAALLLQPIVVFTSNAIEKRQGVHWYAGDALEIALYDSAMTTALGASLLEFPTLLTVLNYGWVVLLAGAIPILLFPRGWLRACGALAYLAAFAGMALTLSVGLFPLALGASVLPFLTTPFWDQLTGRVTPHLPERISIRGRNGSLGSAPVERRVRRSLEARGHGPAVSRTVALGRPISTVLAVAVLAWMIAFAAVGVAGVGLPAPLDSEHLDQQDWGLYAPDPAPSQSWYVVEAKLEDGSVADARTGDPVSFDRPPDASAAYESFRHRSFMQTVDESGQGSAGDALANHYAEWACERATAHSDTGVERVGVYRVERPKPLDGTREDPERVTVVERSCR